MMTTTTIITNTRNKPPQLNPHILSHIISYTPLRRNFACVCKSWYVYSNQEEVWLASLRTDFKLDVNNIHTSIQFHIPVDNNNDAKRIMLIENITSFQQCYQLWREFEIRSKFVVVNGNLWIRSVRVWNGIRSYLTDVGANNVCNDLNPGISPSIIKTATIPILEHDYVIYANHNGSLSSASPTHGGLFGSIIFYNKVRYASFVEFTRKSLSLWNSGKGFMFFQSTDGKILRCQVRYQSSNNTTTTTTSNNSTLTPITSTVIIDQNNSVICRQNDGILGFMEDFYQQLLNERWGGSYLGKFSSISPPFVGALSAFPFAGPRFSVGENQGIIITASWVPTFTVQAGSFTTHNGEEEEEEDRFLAVYHITIRTANPLPENRIWHGNVTLTTRTWIITHPNRNPEQVHGPGVIGLFPQLYEDETIQSQQPLFSYQSCSEAVQGTTMEGFLTFESKDSNNGNTNRRIEFNVPIGKMTFNVGGNDNNSIEGGRNRRWRY
jgi:uncharacterized protein affecting Mg2+/Co2+ transport